MKIDYIEPITEEFIRENKDQLNWSAISLYQKLNENFIREFQDKVDWYSISYKQELSIEFIKEFQNKINWVNLLNRYNYIIFYNDHYRINHCIVNSSNNDRYRIKSSNGNYCSDNLNIQEFINLSIKLISLKAFQ